MMRSNFWCGALSSCALSLTLCNLSSAARLVRGRGSFFKTLCLATVSPCYDDSKNNVKAAEACGHKVISQSCWSKQRHCAEQHKTDSHYRNDLYRKCPARHNRRPIEQKPHARQSRVKSCAVEHDRQ